MKVNSAKAWFYASRPKTLTGAMAPVIVGGAMAWFQNNSLSVVTFVLCLLFAIIMQIDANIINDYFDWKKGTDREDRLGPERACAQGWITPSAMKIAIVITTIIACAVGLPLALTGGWWLIGIGLICVIFSFLYTTYMSYHGLGDILVILFFGLIPVGFTYYVQTHEWNIYIILFALAQGLVTDNLLIVNNYRDYYQDMISGKKTIIVRFGKAFGLWAYLFLGIIACALSVTTLILMKGEIWQTTLLLPYILLHTIAFMKMRKLKGRELNKVLGETARNIFLFALLLSLGMVL